jgi:hypothetical protein
VGFTFLVQLWAVREVISADDTRAYFLGRPIGFACGFRTRFGVPCPGCGVTRGVAFAVRGDLAHAWRLSPAAALGVGGLAALALALLGFAWLEWLGEVAWARRTERWIRTASVAYAGAAIGIWLGEWAFRAGAAMLAL